jgi:hypothetical protein
MDRNEIEMRLKTLLRASRNWLPEDQLQDMLSLVQAGEPGVALENYCTQLFEYDVQLSQSTWAEVGALGDAMGVDRKYWLRLARAGVQTS